LDHIESIRKFIEEHVSGAFLFLLTLLIFSIFIYKYALFVALILTTSTSLIFLYSGIILFDKTYKSLQKLYLEKIATPCQLYKLKDEEKDVIKEIYNNEEIEVFRTQKDKRHICDFLLEKN